MSKSSVNAKKIDFSGFLFHIKNQFENIDLKNPAIWPVLPKLLLALLIVLFTVSGVWYFYLNSLEEDLVAQQAKELSLRKDYEVKLQKAVSLEALKKQREQVQQYVIQLEKQLPSKSEMAALLSDINQAGLGRSLQFELFKPGAEDVKQYYAELPITVKVSGNFHDMGSFVSDVAHLSRIVTLGNISIEPKAKGDDGLLQFDSVVKTYRYLDVDEIQMHQQKNQKNNKKGKK